LRLKGKYNKSSKRKPETINIETKKRKINKKFDHIFIWHRGGES